MQEKKKYRELTIVLFLESWVSSWSAFYFLLSTSQSFLIVPLPASWEICIQVKKQHLEPDMEQQTGSKSGKEYIKDVYCHRAYLTSMRST